jgi:hypothetical protein
MHFSMVLFGAMVTPSALHYRLNYWSRDYFDAFGCRDDRPPVGSMVFRDGRQSGDEPQRGHDISVASDEMLHDAAGPTVMS